VCRHKLCIHLHCPKCQTYHVRVKGPQECTHCGSQLRYETSYFPSDDSQDLCPNCKSSLCFENNNYYIDYKCPRHGGRNFERNEDRQKEIDRIILQGNSPKFRRVNICKCPLCANLYDITLADIQNTTKQYGIDTHEVQDAFRTNNWCILNQDELHLQISVWLHKRRGNNSVVHWCPWRYCPGRLTEDPCLPKKLTAVWIWI
jgi:hypothetical protein